MVLRDVHYVPGIMLNLILTGRLDDVQGYNGSFHNGIWKFYKGNLIVARAKKQNTLYVLHDDLVGTKLMWQLTQLVSCGIRGYGT